MLTGGAHSLAELVADDDLLTEHVRSNVAGTFHVVRHMPDGRG